MSLKGRVIDSGNFLSSRALFQKLITKDTVCLALRGLIKYLPAYMRPQTCEMKKKKGNEVNFGEWYGKHWHLHLARHRVSESSSAKYGPGKDFALCVNQNWWHITMSVLMGLTACVVFYVRNSFLSQ